MYISFKAWFDACNKMLLSVKWYHCIDLAIYTDLFTLTSRILGSKEMSRKFINFMEW